MSMAAHYIPKDYQNLCPIQLSGQSQDLKYEARPLTFKIQSLWLLD